MTMTENTPTPTPTTVGARMSLVDGVCRCGCGTPTNRGSWFRQGHDARLKGNLQQALRTGKAVEVTRADGTIQTMTVADACKWLTPELASKVMAESTSSRARRRQPSDGDAIAALAKAEGAVETTPIEEPSETTPAPEPPKAIGKQQNRK